MRWNCEACGQTVHGITSEAELRAARRLHADCGSAFPF